jgi:Ca2+-binding EF-hand superfamily protein
MPLTGGEIRAVLRKLDTDGSGSIDYKELLSFAKQPPTASSTTDGDSADGNIMSRLVSSTSKLLGRGAASPSKRPTKKSSKEQQKHKSKKHNKGSDDDSSGAEEEDGDAPTADVDSDVADANGKSNGKKGGKKTSTTAVLRGLKARVAAVSRAAATAAATAAAKDAADADADAEHSGSDGDADVARRRVTVEDAGPDWGALLAAQDPDETGSVLVRSAAVAFEEGGVPLSELELTAVSARFASTDSSSSSSVAVQPLVKWLIAAARTGTASAASGSSLDDATLRRIQKHVRGRLGRAFDLRALFQEMSGGRGHLTGKSLSKGLRRAGLKVDKAVATELVQRFDRDCDGRLEYTEFQRLVHAAGLAELDNPVSPMARAR